MQRFAASARRMVKRLTSSEVLPTADRQRRLELSTPPVQECLVVCEQ